MTSSTQFYRKPVKVRAIQWSGQHEFVKLLKANLHYNEITEHCVPELREDYDMFDRLREVRSYVQSEHTLVIHFDSDDHRPPVEIVLGSWMVFEWREDPGPDYPVVSFHSDTEFHDLYFTVETVTEVKQPELSDLI